MLFRSPLSPALVLLALGAEEAVGSKESVAGRRLSEEGELGGRGGTEIVVLALVGAHFLPREAAEGGGERWNDSNHVPE